MGEYAEMMLDGTCCSSCGEYLDCDPAGYAQQCPSCSDYDEPSTSRVPKGPMRKATKKLLMQFSETKNQLNLGEGLDDKLYSLEQRGYVESGRRYGFYKLTDAGREAINQLIKLGAG